MNLFNLHFQNEAQRLLEICFKSTTDPFTRPILTVPPVYLGTVTIIQALTGNKNPAK